MNQNKKKGVYEIYNNEGAICFVNTVKKNSEFYGKNWEDICESVLNGKVIEGVIDRAQYKQLNELEERELQGALIKIGGKVEAFLPGSLFAKSRDADDIIKGEKVAIMVESFDPLSSNIIVKELKVAEGNFDINAINQALNLIGKAQSDNKFVSGTIVGESKNKIGNRAGFIVSISGIEAFLPMSKSYFGRNVEIGMLIGHNVLCTVEEINVEKMSVVISSLDAYEKLLGNKSLPSLNSKTVGLVGWVTPYNIYVLLPKNILGLVSKKHHQGRTHGDWLNLTGKMIECVPFKIKKWNEHLQDYQVYLTLI